MGGFRSAVLGLGALAIAGAAPLAAADDADRARSLMREFACMVCDGQSIADSDAEIAVRMRDTVDALVAQGLDDGQVRAQMVARYGEGVLLRPPTQGRGVFLWLAPLFIVILAGGVAASVFGRRDSGEASSAEATPPSQR